MIAVVNHIPQYRHGHFIAGNNDFLCQELKNTLLRSHDFHGQYLLVFPPVQCQNTVSCRLFHRFFVIIIHLVYALGFSVLCRTCDFPFFHGNCPDIHAVVRLVGNAFRNNILCALYGFLHRLYFFFLIDIFRRLFLQRGNGFLRQNPLRQPFQSFFLRHAGPCFPFGTVRAVQIFHNHQRLRRKNFFLQLLCQLTLLLYAAKYLFLLFLQIAQISQPFIQITQHLIVQ